MNIDELKEEMDIEDEMNEEGDDSDTDSDLLIQALRDRIRAAAYLQALGHKLPFGIHFGLIHSLPQAQEALKKAHEESEQKLKGCQLPFVCSEKNCGAKFSSWSLLNVHLNVHRHAALMTSRQDNEIDDGREEGELFQMESMPVPTGCPLCGDMAALADLNTHVKIAHGIDGVVCPHCGKILSKACTLNRHIEQVHLNLQIHKPAKCTDCGKMFSKKGHLDRHTRTIHMGIKDNSEPCPYCGKIFSTKSSLEPHIDMVHRGVRRECPECGKVLSDLWKHMRTVHGLYRRRAKIPKDKLGNSDGNESSPTKSIYDFDVSTESLTPKQSSSDVEIQSPEMKTSFHNNNGNSRKNNNVKVAATADNDTATAASKNKRKSSPPVKVKMSFNSAKAAKKAKAGKS